MDLYPTVCHVCNCPPRELHHPLCYQNHLQSPWASIHLPVYAGSHRCGSVFINSTYSTQCLSPKSQRDWVLLLPSTDVLHSYLFLHRVSHFAFDRFVAIRNPLQYTVVLTPPRIIGMELAAVVRGVVLMAPLPILLNRLSFCKDIVLSHCYCYHPDVMKLACGPVRVNIIYGLFLVLCSFGVDSTFIVISYILILKTVLGIASKDGQLKALNTCVSHIFTVCIFYVPLIVLALIHRFGIFTSPLLHVTMANLFLFLTPVLNPLVYSLKTTQIRSAVQKICKNRRNWLK